MENQNKGATKEIKKKTTSIGKKKLNLKGFRACLLRIKIKVILT